MLQPMLVVVLAYFFLKERHSGLFFQCAFWVILNALFIGFPNFDFGFSIQNAEVLRQGVIYAFLAMIMWGAATVAGKAPRQSEEPKTGCQREPTAPLALSSSERRDPAHFARLRPLRRPSRPKQHRDFHQTERRLTSHRSGDIAQDRKKGGLKFLYRSINDKGQRAIPS